MDSDAHNESSSAPASGSVGGDNGSGGEYPNPLPPPPGPGQRPRLHLSSLPAHWGNSHATEHFRKFGQIQDVVIFHDAQGRARYGFLEFKEAESAQRAIARWDGQEVEGAHIAVKYAAPKGTPTRNSDADARRLYVGNIGAGTTNEEVRSEFQTFGRLEECTVWVNHRAVIRPGAEPSLSAFVTFERAEDARAARDAMHSRTVLRGKEAQLAESNPDFVATPPLICDFARPKDRAAGGAGGGGYGGRMEREDRYMPRSGMPPPPRDAYRERAPLPRGYDDRDRRYDDRRYDDRDRRYDDRRSDDRDRRYDDRRYDDRRYDDDRRRSDDRDRSSRDDRDRHYDDRERRSARDDYPADYRSSSRRSRSRSRSPRRR